MWMVALWCLLGTEARASGDAEEAEITFQLGARAYGQGDYEAALAYFLASNRLAPNPSVSFNIAKCYAKTNRPAEAYRWFTLAEEGLTQSAVRATVQADLQEIIPRVVIYEVTSDPPGATVFVERKELGAIGVTPFKVALDPSSKPRTFVFAKDGWEDSQIEGIGGARGQTVPVTGTLRQVVGIVDIHAPESTVVHQGAPEGPEVCVAPCKAKLAPGNWVLYFRREGYRDAVRQLEVVADQTITTVVELAPNTGSVVVNASERGALVQIDGEAVGFTPTVAQGVPVGERLVRVSRPGYEPIERVVRVETDRQITLEGLELLPLDEVTAVSRRAERIELAPSSVTVISSEELRAFQYPTIYEALRGVRGFALSYDSIYGSATVRGLGQANDYNNRLLILQDGAVLNDNILIQGFISYDGRMDLGGIERIEVVRGPGSVLYGTGAVSGVVNLVGESAETPEATEFSFGTYDNHVLRARAQAHYNLSDEIGFRAAVSGGMSQGRLETIDPKGPVATPLQVDSFDQFAGASTNGRIWLGDATFQWFHTWRDITIPTGVYFTEFGDDDHVWTDVRSMAELRYEPKLSESATLLSRVYFNRYYYAGLLPYVGYDSLEEYLGLSAGGEVRLVVEAGDPFRVTVGGLAEVSPTVTLTGVDQDAQGDPLDAPYLDADFPYQVAAGYALVDIVPIDEIRLTAGGRVDFWSATESLAVSPRLALVMVPDEGDFVKLLFGRAFRAPSIYEVAYDTPFQAAPELGTLEPETVWSGELEYSHAFDASWTGLVAAHGSLAQNIVETVGIGDVDITDPKYDPTAVTYINSEDPIRILGGDAELRRGFQGGWMMSGFYSFLDSRYVSDELENTLVPNVPQHSAGLKVIVPVSQPIARVAFRSALEAPRRISLARGNTTDWAVVADVVLSGTVPERGFDYAVGVYNLFNQAYSLPSGDTFPTATLPQQGRSFMANLSLRL